MVRPTHFTPLHISLAVVLLYNVPNSLVKESYSSIPAQVCYLEQLLFHSSFCSQLLLLSLTNHFAVVFINHPFPDEELIKYWHFSL